VDFDLFLPHSSVDALFVLGNILVFLMAAIGFVRFWKAMTRGHTDFKMGFFPALFSVVGEILSHGRFRQCGTNHPRAIAHMILLFGFIGAMITTGAVFVFVFIPHYLHLLGLESLQSWFTVPIDLPHPVKFIGALSGIGLVVGSVMLIYRRWTNKDEVGANGYADYLFLYIIFFTGLTGMGAWLIRATGIGTLAYITYFIHMVFVFFLLWYMPYSKFAHMIYRTLALVHARRIGRQPRSQEIPARAA
jgi:quinone-modifying oxidoreductase subunit QmoC